ncbi:hypothetical protein C8Q77DRAFT_1137849 [Trametes polyzona]|nr:hypothetical protein C8Q77DRAFT_1137849 [Trametes polyzona]
MERLIRTHHYEALRTTDKTVFIILPTNPRLSDGDAFRVPPNTTRTRDAEGLVNYYEQADDDIERLWREKLGRWLYNHIVKEDMARKGISPTSSPDKVYLANFPANYTLWTHKKGHPHDPRIDHYLYGSRFVDKFRSPMEFCLHLKWILDGQPMKPSRTPDCRCRWCDGTIPQAEISSAFGTYHPPRRDKDRKDKDRDGKRGPRTKRAAPSTSTSIPFKDYTKLNTTSAA